MSPTSLIELKARDRQQVDQLLSGGLQAVRM
jgi:hypothetical protein